MRYLVINKKKERYGPLLTALMGTGVKVKLIDEVEPDDEVLLFCNKPLLVRAKKVGWYMCDLRDPRVLENGVKYDYIFLCNKTYLKEYEEVFGGKAFYMPQCGDETPIKKESFWDVVFIGNLNSPYHKNRAELLQEVQTEYNLKLVSGREYSPENKYLYRDIPISLSISDNYEGYTSNRLYNILSCGGFCLSLYFPGIEDLFENKKHLVWFHDKEEMMELIEYYLTHPTERKKIAKEGQKEYYKNHSAKVKLKKMFESFA